MIRWSNDIDSVHDVADGELTLVHPGPRFDGAEADDRALPRVEDRGTAVDAEDADIRDAERAARQVGRAACAPRGPSTMSVFSAAASSRQREAPGVLDVRHEQPARGRDGDPQIELLVQHDLAARPRRGSS